MVKVAGGENSSEPTVGLVLQVNSAPVSSFCAEYSSVEVVVERPVAGFTSTEALMDIPGRATNNFKKGVVTQSRHSRTQRVRRN